MVRSRRLPDKVYRSLPSLRVGWHGGGGRDVVFPVECVWFLIIIPDADVMLMSDLHWQREVADGFWRQPHDDVHPWTGATQR